MQIIDDLIDRTEWIAASVLLQSTQDESVAAQAFARIAVLQERMSTRDQTPFRLLTQRFGLSETEQQVLMLLVAMRMRAEVRSRIQQAVSAAELGLDAIRNLIYGSLPSLEALQELAPTETLRRMALIERNDEQGAHTHESKHTWSIAPRVLAFLHGDEQIDPSLARFCRIDANEVAVADLIAADDCITVARAAMSSDSIIVVSGMAGLGRRTLLQAIAHDVGKRIIDIDARKLAQDPTVLRAEVRAIARESRLMMASPLLANVDALGEERIAIVGDELACVIDGPILVTSGMLRPQLDWGRAVIAIEMTKPSSAQSATAWRNAIAGLGEQDVQHLATNYPLAPAMIARAAAAAKARANGRTLKAEDIVAGVRAVLDDKVGRSHAASR